MKKKMIYRFSAPLPFLRLSKVRSLPRAVVHTKKLTLKCFLTFKILIQEKEEPHKVDTPLKNDRTSNFFLLERIHQIKSSLPFLRLREYNTLKNASTTSTFQSCTACKKDTFH